MGACTVCVCTGICVSVTAAWSGDAKLRMTLAGRSCPLGELVIGHTHTTMPCFPATYPCVVWPASPVSSAISSAKSPSSPFSALHPFGACLHRLDGPATQSAHRHTYQTFIRTPHMHKSIHGQTCTSTHTNTGQTRYGPKGRPNGTKSQKKCI